MPDGLLRPEVEAPVDWSAWLNWKGDVGELDDAGDLLRAVGGKGGRWNTRGSLKEAELVETSIPESIGKGVLATGIWSSSNTAEEGKPEGEEERRFGFDEEPYILNEFCFGLTVKFEIDKGQSLKTSK